MLAYNNRIKLIVADLPVMDRKLQDPLIYGAYKDIPIIQYVVFCVLYREFAFVMCGEGKHAALSYSLCWFSALLLCSHTLSACLCS